MVRKVSRLILLQNVIIQKWTETCYLVQKTSLTGRSHGFAIDNAEC